MASQSRVSVVQPNKSSRDRSGNLCRKCSELRQKCIRDSNSEKCNRCKETGDECKLPLLTYTFHIDQSYLKYSICVDSENQDELNKEINAMMLTVYFPDRSKESVFIFKIIDEIRIKAESQFSSQGVTTKKPSGTEFQKISDSWTMFVNWVGKFKPEPMIREMDVKIWFQDISMMSNTRSKLHGCTLSYLYPQ